MKLFKNIDLQVLTLAIGISISVIAMFAITIKVTDNQELSIELISGILGGIIAMVTGYLFGKYTNTKDRYKEIIAIKEKINELTENFKQKHSNSPKVFFSYSHMDKKYAYRLLDFFKDTNIQVLTDENILSFGDNIENKIKEALANSEFIILLISKNWLSSSFSNKELKYALKNNKRVIPIVLDDSKLPSSIMNIKYTKLKDDNIIANAGDVLNTIKSDLEKKAALY